MSRRNSSGFSALEALAAVALLGIVLVPLLGLQIDLSRRAQRSEALQQQLLVQKNCLAVLRELNIAERESGAFTLTQQVRVQWRARALTPFIQATRQGQGTGDFAVALYQVDISIQENGRETAHFSTEQIGWRHTPSPEQIQ